MKMLKAVIVDANAVSRGLLNSVLMEGGYEVVGQTHLSHQGLALLQKHHAHLICIALDQVEDGENIVEQIREQLPKTFIFMVSGEIDANTLKAALARGVQGFIVKPFKADAVLKTIRNTVIAAIKKNQA
jgi:two-component system chemotaxis response regulator CheY